MNEWRRKDRWVIQLFLLFALGISCEDLIEYSPYQNIVRDKWKEQNITNYQQLKNEEKNNFEPFKIALISDTHTYYDAFNKQVDYINTLQDIDFVIHLGDITLSALNREFNWYSTIINGLKYPVITVIGNHDCLSNGYDIYTNMFGPSNFCFAYKDVKFVIFDDIVWEKDIEHMNFKWLSTALKNDQNYSYVIPFAHLPPWDDQFSFGDEFLYNHFMEKYNIDLSIHGHSHRFELFNPYGKVNYLTVPSCNRDQLVIISFQPDTILWENVSY